LKIASVVLANRTVLLTRNSSDFERVVGLSIDNWT
jgi:predicted nucleic acid-binding protein